MSTAKRVPIKKRLELVMAMVGRTEPVATICRRFGVSRPVAYKYLRRFEQEGLAGLEERSRRRLRGGWGERWRRRVTGLRRRRPTWGARKLRWWLRRLHQGGRLPSERTLHRWLQQAGLASRPVRKRAGAGPHPRLGVPQTRRCDDVWSVDFKGWVRGADGRRIEPLTVRDLHSRYLLTVTPVASTSDRSVRRVFVRLFRRYGVPKVILADRGAPFCGTGPHGLTTLSLWWHRLGIRVCFVDKSRRIHNNAHEQMHRILKQDFARCAARDSAGVRRWLERWRALYNHARPHQSLGQRPPASRYRCAERRPQALRDPSYPAGWLVRRVKPKGDILLCGRRLYVGRAFAGLPVGLRPLGDGRHEVLFATLLLDTLTVPCSQPPDTKPEPQEGRADAPPFNPPRYTCASKKRIPSVNDVVAEV